MTQPLTHVANGPDFYDDEAVFTSYLAARLRAANPNDTLEKPVTWQLLHEAGVAGAAILDLGCGDAAIGVELLAAGCRSYLGIEGSQRMVEEAKKQVTGTGSEIVRADFSAWSYPVAHFDLVISRLALHYIEDLAHVCRQVYRTLKPGGHFIFSIEHPVMTCCNRSRGASGDGLRQDWIVDDYFLTGRREVMWMGKQVIKHHRTVEDYFAALQAAGFTVTRLRESRPNPALFTDEALLQRRSRTPLFLFLAAQRD